MDANHFDALTQRLVLAASRRALLRSLGVGAVAALLGRSAKPASALKADGARCKRNGQCGSGICKQQGKKRKGRKGKRRGGKPKKRCQSHAEARGCTVENACGRFVCPDFPAGNCAVTVGGKGGTPFCYTDALCFACETHDDCVDTFGEAGARCVHCSQCGPEANHRACVVFAPDGSCIGTCSEDANCDTAQGCYCRTSTGLCQSCSGPCKTDNDCPTGGVNCYCSNGQCVFD